MNAEDILKSKFPAELVDALLAAFREIDNNYVLQKWKASELDAGHFVEAARRILEHALFGSYTPLDTALSNFTDAELRRYEQASGDESLRILIPRCLKAIYGIRNKRGVGHLSGLSPNEMDATLILYTAKWVLAELVRLSGNAHIDDARTAVEGIIERHFTFVWTHNGITRVLVTGVPARDQVLILLYHSSPQPWDMLRSAVEYSHPGKFRAILRELHKGRLIEFDKSGTCTITPKGIRYAEKLLLKLRRQKGSA